MILNPWLTKARKRRVQESLLALFLGRRYREVAFQMTSFAQKNPEWQRNFAIFATVNIKNKIESIEIREV